MKCILSIALAGMVFANTATAGSIETPEIVDVLPVTAAATAPDWTGFYAGVVGGTVMGSNFWAANGGVASSLPDDWAGTPIGITLGVNRQLSNAFVVGLEGDYSFGNVVAISTESLTFVCGNGAGCETHLNNIATLRGRVGASFGNVLVFGTVGYGMAAARGITNDGALTVGERSVSGLAWGGGVEIVVGNNWSAKIEYLDMDLGRFALRNGCSINCYTDISFQTLRFGINRQF